MDAARWEQVEGVFSAALTRSGVDRVRFLDEACHGDSALRHEVERLLTSHEADPAYLEAPLAQVTGMVPPDEPTDEARIGPYRSVRLLGRGGMGEVYLAMQEGGDFERPVAVKVIRRGMDTEDVLRRFRMERRILAGLAHPNIAGLLDGGVTGDGRPYFVMEYVDGLPVDEYCRRHALPVEERLRLVLEVCDAVQHAHQNLVVHRDLKPSNVLVTAGGRAILLDFGIGKLLDPEGQEVDGRTRTGLRLLTPEYASPEQVRGEPVSTASDVYGLGVLLYRILTGHSPYGDETRSYGELERLVLDSDPRRPSTVSGQRRLAGDLDTILLKCLRKEPARRYGSAAALASDLRRHLAGEPVRARGDAFAYVAGRFVRRNRVPLTAALVVFLSLGGATWTSVRQSHRVAAERDKALEVRSFLLEMFGATGPDQATGDTVTARQLLDRQVGLLASAYPDPVMRAEMSMVLAEGYDRLGLPAEAEPLASEALALRTDALGPSHPDVARSLSLLGWVLHEQGRSDEGEAFLREAIPIWRGATGDPGGFSRTLNDLGVIREAAGEYDEAEALYLEALALRRQGDGDGGRAQAVTASNLSVIRYRKGDLPGAVAAATEALQAMRGALGPDHQRSIIIQSNLAAMRSAMGDDTGAEAEYRDLLQRQERLRGGEDPVTVRVVGSLAATLANQGLWGEAEGLYRRALATQEAQLGAAHPEVGRTRVRLGQALTGLERFEEARRVTEEGRAVLQASIGATHPVYAEALESLADAWEGDDPERAEALHREAIGILDARLGSGNQATAQARMRLADRLKARGRAEDALALYSAAHHVFLATLPPEHRHVHRTRMRMAEVGYTLGERAMVDSLLAEAEEGFALGGAPPEMVALHDTLRTLLAGG